MVLIVLSKDSQSEGASTVPVSLDWPRSGRKRDLTLNSIPLPSRLIENNFSAPTPTYATQRQHQVHCIETLLILPPVIPHSEIPCRLVDRWNMIPCTGCLRECPSSPLVCGRTFVGALGVAPWLETIGASATGGFGDWSALRVLPQASSPLWMFGRRCATGKLELGR